MDSGTATVTATATAAAAAARFRDFGGNDPALPADGRVHETAFSEIPFVDLSGESEADVVASLRDACTNVGFFYLRGHGIDESVVEDAFAAARRFFAAPEAVRRAVQASAATKFLGYESTVTFSATRPNNHEAFMFGYDVAMEGADAGGPGGPPNQWPEGDAEFRSAVSRYYVAVMQLARRLARLLALVLGLPADFLSRHLVRPGSVARLIHYPPQAPQDAAGRGIGEHTDYECFTLLYQGYDAKASLQVLNSAGEWVEAPPVRGAFVVNIGDLLMRWTNDYFKSTVHRVINTTGRERFSIPVFVGPDYDTLVTPLEQFRCHARRQYAPVVAGQYVLERIEQSRTSK